jgi:hypothetical protein
MYTVRVHRQIVDIEALRACHRRTDPIGACLRLQIWSAAEESCLIPSQSVARSEPHRGRAETCIFQSASSFEFLANLAPILTFPVPAFLLKLVTNAAFTCDSCSF